MTTISLVIPSYRRPDGLRRVLRAAKSQVRPFDELIVGIRRGDDESRLVALDEGARVVEVDAPGVIAAMVAGARAATSLYVAFTDDDAVPPPEWSSRILEHFHIDPGVTGVGGRDVLFDEVDGHPQQRATSLTSDVGRFTWSGRLRGNHHRGTGDPLDVVVLKGVNSAYRRLDLAFPQFLRGDGAQAHFELAIGTRIRSRGGRLLYDPSLTVDHHPATRIGADQRGRPAARAVADSAYNLLRSTPAELQRRRYLYTKWVGDFAYPGALATLAALCLGRVRIVRRWRPTQRGMREAWRDRDVKQTWLFVKER
jgi:glycosyltransferase involved in cell wall biosynthesis